MTTDTPVADGRSPQRIVSLAPSATETLTSLGVSERLVGVTNHCEVDDAAAVGGWLNPNYDAVDDLRPDLVLTADPLQADVRDRLRDRGYEVYHSEPQSLGAVVESFAELGRAVGRPKAGLDLAWNARGRLRRVRRLIPRGERPVVYCEEWSEPPMAAGNWVPEAVVAAGGRYPFVDPGERSREVTAADVEAAGPEHVFLHVCGRGERVDPATVTDRDWDVPALDRGNVHVIDDSNLNQPSPRLLAGIETVAAALHPGTFEQ